MVRSAYVRRRHHATRGWNADDAACPPNRVHSSKDIESSRFGDAERGWYQHKTTYAGLNWRVSLAYSSAAW